MMNHTYVKLRKEFRIALGKLQESGKILEKDLWVRAHSKENTVERFKRDVAPVELNGLTEITISKELERIENGNESSEIS